MKSSSYKCLVTDHNGNRKTITVQGESESSVIQSFRGTGLIPLEVTQVKESSSRRTGKKNAKSVLEFTQMMEQLIASGLSMKDSLEITATIGGEKKGCTAIAAQLLQQVEKGTSFADAVSDMDDVFPSVYRGIISVGNRVGSVEHIFPRLRIYLETTKKIKDKFMGAMAYPMMVLFTAVIGVIAMAVFVFPKLEEMFAEFGGDAANMLKRNIDRLKILSLVIFAVILVVVFTVIFMKILSAKNRDVNEAKDRFLLKIPLLKNFLISWDTLNFAFAMETLTAGGVTVEAAIPEAESVITNTAYKNALKKVTDQIVKGVSLSRAFSSDKIFPDYMSRWLIVGEKSGKTEQVFGQIRNYFQSAVEKFITRFMALIEPSLIILIGVVILLFVVTVVVPIFSLYGSIL